MKHLYLVISLFFLSNSCKKNHKLSCSEYGQYLSDHSVASEIDFFPVELYKNQRVPDTADLKIHFKTTELFPCINFGIALTTFINNNELIVRFDSIQRQTRCFAAIGAAKTYIELAENIRRLVLINGQTIDKYQIAITDEKVEINPIDVNFSNLKYDITFRYPQNTFAYICGTDLNNKHIYNDFLKILTDSTSVTEFEFNGAGRIPYPDSSSGHWSDNASGFFSYDSQSEFDRAGELLRNFTLENIPQNTGVTIRLTSWNNGNYMSWLFDE